MAYLGSLARCRYAHEAAANSDMTRLVLRYTDKEATPTLRPVPGKPRREILQRPHVHDAVVRLALEASDRIPTFLLPAESRQPDCGRLQPKAQRNPCVSLDRDELAGALPVLVLAAPTRPSGLRRKPGT